MKKSFLIGLLFIAVAYTYSMGKKDIVTQALVRAQTEFGATNEQLEQIRSLLQAETDLIEDKADEIIIGIVFPETSEDEELMGPKRWFWVGDLIDHLAGRGIVAHPQYGYIFPHTMKLAHHLTHLVSFQQIYGTCGYHALANAHAIQKQVDQGAKQISFENTKRYAQEVFKDVFVERYHDDLERCAAAGDEEIGTLLQIADGKQVAVISEQGDPNPPTGGGISERANFFVLRESPQFLTEIDQSGREQFIYSLMNNKATHFLILSPGHFTELSVLKDGSNYHMYYLNSMNSSEIGSSSQKFITLVDGLITQAQGRLIESGLAGSRSSDTANSKKRQQAVNREAQEVRKLVEQELDERLRCKQKKAKQAGDQRKHAAIQELDDFFDSL